MNHECVSHKLQPDWKINTIDRVDVVALEGSYSPQIRQRTSQI